MPWYVGDYLVDTTNLNTEQHGAYCLMLMAAWKRGGSLPKDDSQLASICKLQPARWRAYKGILLEFFDDTGDAYAHGRVTKERLKAQGISDKKALNGKGGADKRWGDSDSSGTRSQRLAAARAKGTHTKDEWESLQEALDYRCVKCSADAASLNGGQLTKDHVMPIYQGGDDSIFNLQPMCRNCNSGKGNDTTDYRETSGIDWRKRLSECLAKRLANATETPAPARVFSPSPSHTPSELILEPDGSKSTAAPPTLPACPHRQLIALFAEKLPTLAKPKAELWEGKPAEAMRARWKWLLTATRSTDGSRYATNEADALEWFGRFFDFVGDSDFLMARTGDFKCTLQWLVKAENFAKVVQGNYTNKDAA